MKKSLEMMLLLSGFLFPIFGTAKANLVSNYGTEKSEPINYSINNTIYIKWPIKINTKDTDISSYQDLIEESGSLSEEEKLILASKISSSLGGSLRLKDIEVMSQDDFFYNLKKSRPVGVCKQIATHTERFLNDAGIKTASVSGISKNGIGHVYDISKTENGTAIVDYHKILIADTKNIEKTLELYQKQKEITAFKHLFFEGAKFKYRLITNDGRNFLDFIGYDESSKPLKNSLIYNPPVESNPRVSINLGNYLNSTKFNLGGFFLKLGEIKGEVSSPLEKLILSQAGFKKNFSISDFIEVNPEISLIKGNLNNNPVSGVSGNLIINKKSRKGLNLSSRIAENATRIKDAHLFWDITFGGGASYKIPVKNMQIEPYIVSQFTYFPKDIGTNKPVPRPAEIVAGVNLSPNNQSNISFEPYFLWRKWEKGIGINTRLENKYFGINFGGNINKSNYDFCPDKREFKIEAYKNFKNWKIWSKYKKENSDYDKEIEKEIEFNIGGSIKF